MKADRRLFLTADKERLVGEESSEAAFLFASPGDEIADEDVARYGLGEVKQAEPAADKQSPPPANKARTAPAKRTKK